MNPTTRRGLVSALALAPLAAAAAHPRTSSKALAEHWTAGGLNGIVRARFGFTGTSTDRGYSTIHLPNPGQLYMVPLTVLEFDESSGSMFSMPGDGTVLVTPTLMDAQVAGNADWPAQSGVDIGNRKVLLYRAPAGVAPPVYTPGQVTPMKPNSAYDALAGHDTPGSNVPQCSRATAAFAGATLAPGQFVIVPIAFSDPAVAVGPGDAVLVGLTSLPAGVTITASMTGPNQAVAFIENRYAGGAVPVAAGTVQAVATTTVLATGDSLDAWSFLCSPIVQLAAGERIFVAMRSQTPNDFVQVDNLSFVQVSVLGVQP